MKGDFIMVNTSEISDKTAAELAFTKEELRQLVASRNMPIIFDEDCPETTPERALKFRRVNPTRENIAK